MIVILDKSTQLYRIEGSRRLFESWEIAITVNIFEIAYDVGFSELAHFTKSFKNEFNITPNDFRNN